MRVLSIVFVLLGMALASGCHGPKRNGIQLFNVSNGAQLQLLPTTPGISKDGHMLSAISSDGSVLVVGGDNGDLEVWKASTGELVNRIESATSWGVDSIAISPDGETFAVGGEKGGLELRRVSTGKVLMTLRSAANMRVNSVAFSQDGQTLAVCGISYHLGGLDTAVMELWKVSTGTLLTTLRTAPGANYAVAFSPDGRTLAIGEQRTGITRLTLSTYDMGAVELLNVSTGKVLRNFYVEDSDSVLCIAFSPDGNTLAVSGYSGKVELRKVTTGELLKTLDPETIAHLSSLVFSRDGNTLAVGVDYSALQLWDVTGGKLLNTLKSDSYSVATFANTPSHR